MNLIDHLRAIEESRGVPIELLCTALEEAHSEAYRTRFPMASLIAKVDRETASMSLHRRWAVVDDVQDPQLEISKAEAGDVYAIGDFYDREVSFEDFNRVAALTAKRAIAARVLEFEREQVYARYRELEGQLVTGLVQREVFGSLYVLLDERNEAVLPPWERSSRDRHNINDRIVCELQSVRKTKAGPALILSRASERFVMQQIADPSIVRAARAPGWLTMLLCSDPDVDVEPLRALSRELGGEGIELVTVGYDALETIQNALRRWPHSLVHQITRDVVIAVSESREAQLRAPLAGRLAGVRTIAATEATYEDVRAQLEAEDATAAAPIAEEHELVIDPELIAKLQAFALEREAALAADE